MFRAGHVPFVIGWSNNVLAELLIDWAWAVVVSYEWVGEGFFPSEFLAYPFYGCGDMHRKRKESVRLRILQLLVAVYVLIGVHAANGQVLVVDHQQHHTGGPGADTLFVSPSSGITTFQLIAENFTLAQDAQLSRVEWWGCYGGLQQNHQPPIGDETMRVRFYDSRPGDGLPGNVVYEELFLNPSRTATGVNVSTCGPEFFFQTDLASGVPAQAGSQLWLEVAQVGILNSTFRWEYSLANDSMHAVVNRNLPDWIAEPGNGGLAMRLWVVPEPCGACIMLLTALFSMCLSSRRTQRMKPT